jgi:hypothetical protein
MLFWSKLFSIFLLLTIILMATTVNNLLSIILTTEFIIILIFFLYLFNSIIFNLHWIFGFSFIIIILGGLEAALSFLLLNL